MFRDMEKFLIEYESVDMFIEYLRRQNYYPYKKNNCVQYLLSAINSLIRKIKLEKIEKLY